MAREWCPNCGWPIYRGDAPARYALWCECDTFADVARPQALTEPNTTAPLALF